MTIDEINRRLREPLRRPEIAERITPHNRRAHAASMRATLAWADKLAQKGRRALPKPRWWQGDPYGKPPESTLAWSNRVARKNPPEVFRYNSEAKGKPETVSVVQLYSGGYQRPLTCQPPGPDFSGPKRATSVTDAKRQFLKLGVEHV